jgi:hypothetical protein
VERKVQTKYKLKGKIYLQKFGSKYASILFLPIFGSKYRILLGPDSEQDAILQNFKGTVAPEQIGLKLVVGKAVKSLRRASIFVIPKVEPSWQVAK